MHKEKMPSNKTFETKSYSPSKIVLMYAVTATIIILIVYYLPNYFFLEQLIADHAVLLLNALGLQVQTKVINENVYLANIKIVKECTGVQVIAVFLGMIIPLPNATAKNKLLTLSVLSLLLYGANMLRIVLEFSFVYLNILPWSLAHYPLSFLLGIFGVFILILITSRLLPEFGDFLFSIARK